MRTALGIKQADSSMVTIFKQNEWGSKRCIVSAESSEQVYIAVYALLDNNAVQELVRLPISLRLNNNKIIVTLSVDYSNTLSVHAHSMDMELYNEVEIDISTIHSSAQTDTKEQIEDPSTYPTEQEHASEQAPGVTALNRMSRKLRKVIENPVFGKSITGRLVSAIACTLFCLFLLIAAIYVLYYMQVVSSLESFFTDPFLPLRIGNEIPSLVKP